MSKKSFGIIGNPVSHSLSPVLHNYWFNKYNIEATYSLFNIQEQEIETIVKKIKDKELSGVNVTLPYKQKIIPLVDQLVKDIENKKALVIGAGGVSPSIIFSLQKSKIQEVAIINRTHDKSIFLKKKFNSLKILEWNSLEQEISKFDIIINATSLGLKNGEDFQFNFDNVKDNLIYIDTIYNPMETKTLRFLKENKIKTFNGLDMFIYQGQKSFYLWNKINPEIDNQLIDLLISKLK